VLRCRRGRERRASALALEAALIERLPERGILDILTRTAYAIGWHRRFGPVSGSDQKIGDTLGRYALLTFCQSADLGPAQVARHMHGQVSVHELATANKHADSKKIHPAPADVINAFARLTWPGCGAMAAGPAPAAPRSTPGPATCWPRPRSGTAGTAASPAG
jgi:Tn3 transposase DDE domain-containing protein